MERAKKRQRQEDESTTPASTRNPEIFLRLQNISSAGLQQINEIIEAVISKEQEKEHTSQPVTLQYSNVGCIDRTGTRATMPSNVQSAYHWEAWHVPDYNLAKSSSSSSSTSTQASTSTTTQATRYAPSDHISRQARGRYHLSTDPSAKIYLPGRPLSEELMKALGRSVHTDTLLPWVERAKRYGWPPGWLRKTMFDKNNIIGMFDNIEEDEQEKDKELQNDILRTFPLYIWAPNHPEANKMFQHLPKGPSGSETNKDTAETEIEIDETDEDEIATWSIPVLGFHPHPHPHETH
jgi:hypothetical protein